MEHISHNYLNWTVEYIVSGVTNIPYFSKKHLNEIPKDSLKYYWADMFQIHGAVALIEADSDAMNISYFKTNGQNLYKLQIKNIYKF